MQSNPVLVATTGSISVYLHLVNIKPYVYRNWLIYMKHKLDFTKDQFCSLLLLMFQILTKLEEIIHF